MKETKRGTSDPTYLYYTLGKLQILKLREDYRKMKGAQFSLQEFHDNFLKQGFPPIKIVRHAMLGNDSPNVCERMRVLISAGEASGDLYASRVVEALRKRCAPKPSSSAAPAPACKPPACARSSTCAPSRWSAWWRCCGTFPGSGASSASSPGRFQ